jgi:hypothetical protein
VEGYYNKVTLHHTVYCNILYFDAYCNWGAWKDITIKSLYTTLCTAIYFILMHIVTLRLPKELAGYEKEMHSHTLESRGSRE